MWHEIWKSIKRGLPRILALLVLGNLALFVAHLPTLFDVKGGVMPIVAPWSYGIGLVFLGLAVGEVAVRILMPKVDTQELIDLAQYHVGSGAASIGVLLLRAVILMLVVTAARAAEPPAAARPYLDTLKLEQLNHWPDVPIASALGAQVEQETCPSLKSPKCWNPRTQLRTSREQGIGLGQLTRTWNKNGTQRFDALAEIVAAFPKELAGLSWQAPYDPALQLRALILKDRQEYERVHGAASELDRMSFTFSAYNGGAGGVASDRRACAATPGCDSGRWAGNVEHTSLKAKTALPGYGQSFFQTNRDYVRNVLVVRRPRYLVLDAA